MKSGKTDQEYGIIRYKPLYIVGDRKNRRKADPARAAKEVCNY